MALSALLSSEQELSRGHSVIRGNSWCRSQSQYQPPTAIKGLLTFFPQRKILNSAIMCGTIVSHACSRARFKSLCTGLLENPCPIPLDVAVLQGPR